MNIPLPYFRILLTNFKLLKLVNNSDDVRLQFSDSMIVLPFYLQNPCFKFSFYLLLLGSFVACNSNQNVQSTQASTLDTWLATPTNKKTPFSKQAFAFQSIDSGKLESFRTQLYTDRAISLKTTLKTAWEAKAFQYGSFKMPIQYRIFGTQPYGKRSLFLSMHGGGATSAAINDQQWYNQIKLYQPKEGLYLAPRAPTNSWNLWHQAHIDPLFDQIIEAAVLFAGVDQNRVYLTGYSAGGDGTFQLGARMSDRFAAAAMMAGHPNETKAKAMRNLPFALYMGANDAAYDRNKKAWAWKKDLKELQLDDPKGYQHQVQIVANKGHWMDRVDTSGIVWMQQFERNTRVQKIVWLQDDVHQEQSYWLRIPLHLAQTGQKIVATCVDNQINIESNYSDSLYVFLDEKMINLKQKVTLLVQNKLVFDQKVVATPYNMYYNLQRRFDKDMAYPICLLLVDHKKVVLNPRFNDLN